MSKKPSQAGTATMATVDLQSSMLISSLGESARHYGMARLAAETGLSRESLYKALSPTGNPSMVTVARVAHVLGLQLRLAGGDAGQ